MKLTRNLICLLSALLISACASNGEHLYFDGRCLSCWNNPLTGETLDYETLGATNYPQLSWKEMMLEGLQRSNTHDLSPYGEDYLQAHIGNKVVSLKNNEITYRKTINEAVNDLNVALSKHSLKQAYQTTLPSKLHTYDFEKQEFPFLMADSFTLVGGNNLKNLPKEIKINIKNLSSIPNLKMEANEAERFLSGRGNGKSLYVRYIVEITEMISPSEFDSYVREIQFIDIKPSIVTRENKEEFAPIKSIRI